MRSRVMPGSSPTMARRPPVMRLNKVDFPTLGRPTITTVVKFVTLYIFRIAADVSVTLSSK